MCGFLGVLGERVDKNLGRELACGDSLGSTLLVAALIICKLLQ